MAVDRTALQVAVDSLLQFLRIKSGQGPSSLALELVPSMDVIEFYGAQSSLNGGQGGTPGAIAAGTVVAAAVTPRRYLAISGSITIGAAAGGFVTLGIGFTLQPGVGGTTFLAAGSFTPVVGGIYRVVWGEGRGLILPAGHTIGLYVNGNAAGADHVPSIEYGYQRLDGLP